MFPPLLVDALSHMRLVDRVAARPVAALVGTDGLEVVDYEGGDEILL